jgi:hypothetical protein
MLNRYTVTYIENGNRLFLTIKTHSIDEAFQLFKREFPDLIISSIQINESI